MIEAQVWDADEGLLDASADTAFRLLDTSGARLEDGA